MEIITKRVPTHNFNVFLFGDKHTGSSLSDNDGWRTMINMIDSEFEGVPACHNYCVDHGDCIEAIDVTDPRFDLETTPDPRESQILSQIQEAIGEESQGWCWEK